MNGFVEIINSILNRILNSLFLWGGGSVTGYVTDWDPVSAIYESSVYKAKVTQNHLVKNVFFNNLRN